MGLVVVPSILGSSARELKTQNEQDGGILKKFPQNYFVAPTDSVLNIAGNFGEIRPNHFHAGLDVKTAGREGLSVYAAADGYVSRIRISPFGYGKCLYITHPNGFVTVYAHLQRLYGKVADYLKDQQYKLESYEVDLYLDKNILPVKQCDIIAISGNTGGSQSPHLHFEVRDEKTEHAYNPFLFGYKIPDTVPPVISLLKIYTASDSSTVNEQNLAKKIGVFGRKGKYNIPAQPIILNGDIGFGIETIDYGNVKEAGKYGAYSIDLYVDNKRIYYHELNEIGFEESRYINAHIDYSESEKSGRQIQQCFRDENNMLSIYQCVVNEGLYRFDDEAIHGIKFIVKDFFGNSSQLSFQVKSKKSKPQLILHEDIHKSILHWDCCQQNIYETENVKVLVDPCGLYEDIDFKYSISNDTLPGNYSPIHTIQNEEVPLHTPLNISIKTKPIPLALQSKATIVWLDGAGAKKDQKGVYANGWVTAQAKSFGRFTVVVDTVAPSIKPNNIFNGKNCSHAKIISLLVSDNLTGIKSYRATIDGKWVLMEFEYKKAMLFYEFGEEVGQGKHTFEITVCDGKNNARVYKAKFTR